MNKKILTPIITSILLGGGIKGFQFKKFNMMEGGNQLYLKHW